MSNYIQVSAQSRMGQSYASRLNIMDMVARDNKTYNLAEVFNQNLHLPEKKAPEGNIGVIKRTIVNFYWKYGIELNEETAVVTHQVRDIAFGFNTNYDMHSDTGNKAQQAAMYELKDMFSRDVATSGTKNRVVVYVSR